MKHADRHHRTVPPRIREDGILGTGYQDQEFPNQIKRVGKSVYIYSALKLTIVTSSSRENLKRGYELDQDVSLR